jgi:hypothetical protein
VINSSREFVFYLSKLSRFGEKKMKKCKLILVGLVLGTFLLPLCAQESFSALIKKNQNLSEYSALLDQSALGDYMGTLVNMTILIPTNELLSQIKAENETEVLSINVMRRIIPNLILNDSTDWKDLETERVVTSLGGMNYLVRRDKELIIGNVLVTPLGEVSKKGCRFYTINALPVAHGPKVAIR